MPSPGVRLVDFTGLCRTEGDIETPFGVISMPYALRFCETEAEFVRLASKTSRS